MENMKKTIRLSLGRVLVLLRWIVVAGTTGAILGFVGAYFARAITWVTNLRGENPWILYLLPVIGVVIAALYKYGHEKGGTNLVLESLHEGKKIPLRMAPMIFIATILTHLGGGSAGREGAALQLGGSIAQYLGKAFRLDERNTKLIIMCGMSAGFSALFGTPLAATVFAMEVVTVGIMHFSALFPCSVAALTASKVAHYFGGHAERFHVLNIPEFCLGSGIKIAILALLCAGLSIAFCMILHGAERAYKLYLPNVYARAFVGGFLVVLLTILIGRTDYLGGGVNIIEQAMEGYVVPSAFLMKIIFTAITLEAGYKGGEIVPTLFVGATFGCLFGNVIGFEPSLCAACGMMALFCAMTNSPLATLVLGFELFGFEGMPYYLIAVAIGYLESGYYGLYRGQKVMYSKIQPEYINRRVND